MRLFKAHQLVTCMGHFGGEYIDESEICDVDGTGGYVETVERITCTLLAKNLDLLITVGGDGIAAYIADAMLTNGYNVPMLGIAAGTANVGPIVCMQVEDLERCDINKWTKSSFSAIEVISGKHVGYALNDVAIGNTFLGTVDGQVVNLSAEAMALRGEKKIEQAYRDICTEDFLITKNGQTAKHKITCPGQIIASPLDRDPLAGRAIYGALCSAAYTPCKGALALTENVMISAEAEDEGMSDFCQIEHLLFGPGDEVLLTGLTENAQLILDGNPYMRQDEEILLRYHSELITVMKPEIIY